MSLYDDLDADKKSDNVSGWASGIKMFQSHMQLKKAAVTQPKRDLTRKPTASTLTPVVNLNAKGSRGNRDESGDGPASGFSLPFQLTMPKETKKRNNRSLISTYLSVDPEWQFENEYDPLWPNDYEKALKELRERRDREAEEQESKRRNQDDYRDEEIDFSPSPSRPQRDREGGAAIAPPPSLTTEPREHNPGRFGGGGPSTPSAGGSAAAARIMAKYGYKEGQGLGKKEQGMSTALQVQKTSHRIGRIIHEKDTQKEFSIPNPMGLASSMAAYNDIVDDEEEQGNIDNDGPTLTDLLKNPSKVVLLKNMVGPGEVDDDLEPEVKDECQTKYGEVCNVTVFQMPDLDGEDAIRIFVEFKRVESAVKALVDLNGRFFGGRQVKALFYEYEKYTNLELTL